MIRTIFFRLIQVLLLFGNCELFAQSDRLVIPLWENGAPGFEDRKDEPEQARDWWVKNIHHPSLSVFQPPADKTNGTAVVICPGGGHRALVFNSEGRDAAIYLNSIGVAAFVLKYRLFREENTPYTEAHARQDGLRAMRVVRSRTAEFGIDSTRIGIMGFSAGGELAAWTSFSSSAAADPTAEDAVERTSARPDFQVLIYPGPLAVPDSLSSAPPPAFMLAANDDECCSEPLLKLAGLYRAAGVPIELHLYAQGNHAFNMGNRSKLASIKTWPARLTDWLHDNGWLGD
ncbi:MAG: alpha/beta hydrolase [Lewinellaceae bacterium]|nr:alpha/beta hydrolase [Saprospiraceae bacterium]MCB9305087.1 alpha/beta hydrolase [Lewinellaceae bacterium]